jgi:hypothetical protein
MLAAGALPVLAQGQPADRPGMMTMDVSVVTATVEDIDPATRTVTLRGPQGNLVDVKADQNVRNFDQIAKGDRVQAEVYEETAIFVRPASEPPAERQMEKVDIAPKAGNPVSSASTRRNSPRGWTSSTTRTAW